MSLVWRRDPLLQRLESLHFHICTADACLLEEKAEALFVEFF